MIISVKVFRAKYKVKERQYNEDNTSVFNDKVCTGDFRKDVLAKSKDSSVKKKAEQQTNQMKKRKAIVLNPIINK